MDRRYIRSELRTGALSPIDAVANLPETRHSLGWKLGLSRDAVPTAPGHLVFRGARTLNGTYGKQPFGTQEAVDVHTALKSYTIWSAHQLFLENHIASLEAGKDADIAVWDRDVYSVPADQIKDMKCKITLFQGRIVYQDSN